MVDSGTPQTADTYGWDTVFAVHIDEANAVIARAGSSPRSFSGSDDQDGYAVSGAFGSWRITTGGSGDLIRLDLPITTATIVEPGGTSTVLEGANALVDVRLNFLDGPTRQDGTGKSQLLKVRATATASDDKPANVVSIAYTGRSPTFLADTAFQALLQQWLNANLSDFDHVFATVNIDRTADAGAFQWMQPTDVAYAYSDLGTPGDGALGVLCMTKKRPPTGLTQQLSGAIIPALQRAGFAIAKERLLAELLLPAMPHLFPGSAPTDYALSSTGEAIVAAAGNTVSFTVKTAATANTRAKTYQAKVVDLQLTVESAEMKLSVTTETVISPGIRAYCKTQDFLGLHLVDKPDGTQTLGYFDSRPATNDHWTEKDEGLEITEDILGAIALALAALATVGTGGALIGVAALIVGLVVGVMFLTTTLIEDVHRDDAPSIDSLMLNGTTAVTWPDSKDFRLASVELSDSLHLGGALA